MFIKPLRASGGPILRDAVGPKADATPRYGGGEGSGPDLFLGKGRPGFFLEAVLISLAVGIDAGRSTG